MAISYADLVQSFQRTLGRPPRGDEADFFLKQAEKNNLSAFEIGEILSGAPEAQRAQTQQDIRGYRDIASESDAYTLGKAQESLEAKFRGMGRSASGSAYAAAFADVAQKLAAQRSSQLADLYRQRSGASAGAEAERSTGLRQLGYDLDKERRQRAYALEDFYMSRDLQNDYMNQVRRSRRGAAIGQMAGMAAGAGIGFAASGGNPMGAYYGSQAGGQFGGGAGGLFY